MYIQSLFTTLLVVCVLCCAQAQSREQQSLLQEKKQSVEQTQAAFSGKPASFDVLITDGKAGLALTPKNDYADQYLFSQAIASGYYYKQQFDSASIYFEKAYSAAEKGRLIELSTKSLGNLVSIYHYMGLQAKADRAFQQLKYLVETVDTLKNKGDIYYNMGLYNQQQKSYYTIALNYFLKSAELHKAKVDTTSVPKIKTDYAVKLMMVAEIYLQLKQPEKALEYLEAASPYLGISIPVDITAYGKFVRGYAMWGNRQQARKYYDLLHQTIAKAPGAWSEAVSSNLEIAALALKENDPPTAMAYIRKADVRAKQDNKEIMLYAVHLAYGDYYMALRDYNAALRYYNMAQPVADKYSREQYADLLKSLTEANIMTNNTAAALDNFKNYCFIADTLTTQKVSLNISEMEAIYQNKNKQQQIESQDIELDAARQQRFWMVAGLLLLGLIAVLLLIIYRNKRKTASLLDDKNKTLTTLNQQLDAANQTKAKLFGIIGHDLRSPINQVYQFLKLQQLNPGALSEQQKQTLSSNVQEATGSLLETMEDLLLWSKTQMSEFKTQTQPLSIAELVTSCQSLLQLSSVTKNIRYKNDIVNSMVVETDVYYLQTIIRNLLQNAIKASPDNGTICISAVQLNHACLITIENDGKTFSQQDYESAIADWQNAVSGSGLGLHITHELAQKINAGIYFSNPSGNRTIATISLPV
jgi:signal transduction histidine kinase